MKYVFFVIAIVVFMAAGIIYWNRDIVFQAGGWVAAADQRNISYEIGGQIVKLNAGSAETKSVADPALKTTTKYMDNEVWGDINEDDRQDVAFIVTQETGGRMFYYVAAALGTDTGYKGVNAILIGDRIKPRSAVLNNGIITVNYLDRSPDDPVEAAPLFDASLRVQIADGRLIKIE